MTSVLTTLTSLGPYTGIPGSQGIALMSLYPPEVGCVAGAMSSDVIEPVAVLTDTALAYSARAVTEGLAYRVVAFQAGAGGYNPANFAQPLPVTGSDVVTALRYQGPVGRIEPATTDETLWSYGLTLPQDLVGVFGEFALVSEIVHSPLVPSEVGTVFVYAIAHSPAISKHAHKAFTLRLLVRGG